MEYKASSRHAVVRHRRSFFGFPRTVFVHTPVAPSVSRIHHYPVYSCPARSLVLGPLRLVVVDILSLPEFSTLPPVFSEILVLLLVFVEILVLLLVFVEILVLLLVFVEIPAPETRDKPKIKIVDQQHNKIRR